MDGNLLTIRAEHKQAKEKSKDNYVRRERSYGAYVRSFDVSNIKTDEISASYQNGILELVMPKAEEVKPEVKKIDIH